MKLYTRKVYEMFSEEMDKTHNYGVPKTDDNVVFIVKHSNAEYVERFRRSEFRVVKMDGGKNMNVNVGYMNTLDCFAAIFYG